MIDNRIFENMEEHLLGLLIKPNSEILDENYDYHSVEVNFEDKRYLNNPDHFNMNFFKKLQSQIPNKYCYRNKDRNDYIKGKDIEPHITIMYGLQKSVNSDDIEQYLKQEYSGKVLKG